ncbi:MAG TPA: hypothetical protein VF144_20070 [Chitinophagaceae bacterium]
MCIKDEVEDIKFGVVLKNRSFPNGEGDGGWGLVNKEQKAKECDATEDKSELLKLVTINKKLKIINIQIWQF